MNVPGQAIDERPAKAAAMKNPPSEFVQSALRLEEVFANIEQIAESLNRLEPNSEAELERAKKLLMRFTETSQGLQGALQGLLGSLDERRKAVEQSVERVNLKAPLIGQKFLEAEEKVERFQALADRVRAFTEEAPTLGPDELRQRLQEMTDEATVLQEEARIGKLRSLEKNAQKFRTSLKELTRKLG